MFRTLLLPLLALALVGCGAEKAHDDESLQKSMSGAPAGGEANMRTVELSSAAGGRMFRMDLYVPPNPGPNLHRAVILIHGGGWVSGDRTSMEPIAYVLAEDGFLSATTDYAHAQPGQLWPAQLEDVRAAVRYIRSHAEELKIDPTRIAAAGISAGGHLSMFLGVSDDKKNAVSSSVQAVGSISGILDLNLPLTPEGERYKIVQQLLGEGSTVDVAARKKASPINFATKSSAPVFFIQGKQDPLVPPDQSEKAMARLKALGVDCKMVMVDGMGHGLDVSVNSQRAALDELASWLKSKLEAEKAH
jgi:acetyl esterase/lipase